MLVRGNAAVQQARLSLDIVHFLGSGDAEAGVNA
jgi:hypothetical protein